ncbi:MerR family transcriptional regulator [Nocardioides limicola]|uniref:MerR family transcriptional regulator n=1 Tax=Nocardioides limicola TaxID=2803368 RepID=UPI00193B4ADC|nr:MerR family transcriptional regulator [Nocardioides sp. DJM-14]
MYTIKRAAEQVGISPATLRAWERRYAVVTPQRSDGGYRLYGDDDVRVLEAMARLVAEGWSPSQAAREAREQASAQSVGLTDDAVGVDRSPAVSETVIEAAATLDAALLGAALDEMFTRGSFEAVVDTRLLPTLTALGEAWETGRVSVAGEHLVAHAVMRRLGTAYEAAASVGSGARVLLGLAPGGRHELGLFAFAVALRRRGVSTHYLGADLPVADWVHAVRDREVAAVVLAVPCPTDVEATAAVVGAVRAQRPDLLTAVGGSEQDQAPEGVLRLGHGIGAAAVTVAEAIRR